MHLHRSELTPGVTARSRRADPFLLAAAVIGAAWLVAAASHSAGIARTDDWAFARVALTLHRAGHVRLVGWAQMSLLGLVVWAQPFLAALGPHLWVLDLSASVLVAAGVLAAYRLARILAGPKAALVVVATVAAAPGFLRDAGSFMTDGPAFAVGTFALLAGVEAARAVSGSRRWLLEAACVAAGLWAFSIRELALAAPLAVLAARWLGEPRRRRVVAAQGGVLGVSCAVFWAWRSGLPGGQAFGGRPPLFTIIESVVGVVFTTSLLMVPVLAATAPSWWKPRRPVARVVGVAIGAALAIVPIAYAPGSWNRRYQWLTGDYLDPRGVNGNKLLIGSRPRLVPPLGWACIEAIAVIAGIVVAGLLAEALAGAARAGAGAGAGAGATATGELGARSRSHRALLERASAASLGVRLLAAHLAVLFVLLTAAIVLNGATFDRYLWPAALSAGILLTMRYPIPPLWRWHPAASQGALVVVMAFVIVSLVVTLNSDAFDGVRWRLARQETAHGLAPTAVDAGFEWVGYHAPGVANANASGDATRPYWVVMVGERAACLELSTSALDDPNLTLVRTVRWRTWLVLGRARIFEYRRPSACGAVAAP